MDEPLLHISSSVTERIPGLVVICELLAAMGEDIVQSTKSLIAEKFSSVLGGTLSGMVVLR